MVASVEQVLKHFLQLLACHTIETDNYKNTIGGTVDGAPHVGGTCNHKC